MPLPKLGENNYHVFIIIIILILEIEKKKDIFPRPGGLAKYIFNQLCITL